MNEQIQKLAELAGFNLHNDLIDGHNFHHEIEKFAQLIIRECVGVVEGGSFLHDQAPTAIFARECSGAIKQHFGVGE